MGADDARKLFVGGLADSIDEAALRDIFEGSGQAVADVHVPRDRESGRPRGFAFVSFASADAAEAARQAVDGLVHGGRAISVRRFSQDGPRRAPGERAPRPDDRTVFVGKLPYDTTTEEVEALFVEHELGPVARVSLPIGPDGRPRGFGFVTLESPEAAVGAVERLAGAQVRGRTIVVTPAQPRGKGGPPPGSGEPSGRFEGSGRTEAGRGGGRFGGPGFGGPGFGGPGFGGPGTPPRYEPDPGGAPAFDGFHGRSPSGPPPGTDEGSGRRDKKERKKEKKKRAPERAPKRERGGAGTWHRWERDDD